MWHSGDGMGWWMVIGSVWFVFFWVAVIWLVTRVFEPRRMDGPAGNTAMDVARRRYAGGEITKEQFDQLRRDLEQ